jgi:ariadne-1
LLESEGYSTNDDMNDDMFAEKQEKKAYQVDFTVLSSASLQNKQDSEVSYLASVLRNKID